MTGVLSIGISPRGRVWLLLSMALLASCARSHGRRRGVHDAGADAQTVAEPEVEAVQAELDAQLPDASPGAARLSDAAGANVMALVDAAPDAPDAPGAGPQADLVFTRKVGRKVSLEAVTAPNFSEGRVLGSTDLAVTRRVCPNQYSPDGRVLFLIERAENEIRYIFSYPCRGAAPCEAPRSFVTLTSPLDEAETGSFSEARFAPDSSGVLLLFSRMLYYVSLGSEGPAVTLDSDGFEGAARFVAEGAGFVAIFQDTRSGSTPKRVAALFDLGAPTLAGQVLQTADGAEEDVQELQVAPDGEHFTLTFTRQTTEGFAYSARAVLAGNTRGRALGTDWIAHLTDERLVTAAQTHVSMQRWDGSNVLTVPTTSEFFTRGCGEHVFIRSPTGKLSVVDVPRVAAASEAPSARELADVIWPFNGAGRGLSFASECKRAVALYNDATPILINLQSFTRTTSRLLDLARIAPDGTFLVLGPAGLSPVWRVEGLPAAELAFAPAVQGESMGFGHRAPFLIAAGRITDARKPGLYRIDLSQPGPAQVQRLSETLLNAACPIEVSPDDRYAAYNAVSPDVQHDFTRDKEGPFEIDLGTGAVQPLVEATDESDGQLSFVQLPGQRAVFARTTFRGSAAPGAWLAQVDAGPWVSQVNDAQSAWLSEVALSPDGKYLAVFQQGDADWQLGVQKLRTSAVSPIETVATISQQTFPSGSPWTRPSKIVGFSRSHGLIYVAAGPQAQLGSPFSGWPYRVDLTSGVTSPLGTPLAGTQAGLVALGPLKERVQFVVQQDETLTLHVVDAKDPSQAQAIPNTTALTLTPDERHGLYARQIETGQTELRVIDLATLADWRVPIDGGFRDLDANQLGGLVQFDQDGNALVRSAKDELLRVNIGDPRATPQLVARDLGTNWRFDPELHRLLYSKEEAWFLIDFPNVAERIPVKLNGKSPSNVRLSPRGRFLLASDTSGQNWWLFDARDLSRAPTALGRGHEFSFSFDPDEHYLLNHADGSSDTTILRLSDPAQQWILQGVSYAEWIR